MIFLPGVASLLSSCSTVH